jgi:hypothetical protein
MIEAPKWITYYGKRKKCFGIHTNGNYIIKMNNKLVQVSNEMVFIN